jgi:hypothetical protein
MSPFISTLCSTVARPTRERTHTDRQKIVEHLRMCGSHGATDEEMQNALPMNPSTQRPRRGELVTALLVHATGQVRNTKSGHPATVWGLVPRQESFLEEPDINGVNYYKVPDR